MRKLGDQRVANKRVKGVAVKESVKLENWKKEQRRAPRKFKTAP